jgi:Cu+-exporting ATPase
MRRPAVRHTSEEGSSMTDPVCGMQVDPSTAAGSSEYGGHTYYFCSGRCKARFDDNPGQYAK